jgi:hypothetical protein
LIKRSPFDHGKSLLLKENNQRIWHLTKEEISMLLEKCRSKNHLHRIVVCALNTGIRKGEILGLRWDQIRNGFIYLEETKTKNRREIPVNEDFSQVLVEIRKEQGLTFPHVFLYGKRVIDRVDRAFKGALGSAGIFEVSCPTAYLRFPPRDEGCKPEESPGASSTQDDDDDTEICTSRTGRGQANLLKFLHAPVAQVDRAPDS